MLKCSAGTKVGTATIYSNNSVNFNNKSVVKKSDCIINGTFELCRNQPISYSPGFLPCIPQPLGPWKNSHSTVIHLESICTEKSYMMCTFGGKIKPMTKSNNIATGASTISLSSLIMDGSNTKNRNENSLNKNDNLNKSETKNNEIIAGTIDNSTFNKENEELKFCHICNLPLNDNHNNRFLENKQDDINNDSNALRENMLKGDCVLSETNHNEICYLNNAMKQVTGLIYNVDSEASVAHHLISGNQIFKRYKEIVNIAFACGYDINCIENGIFLPTLTDKTKERLKFAQRKYPAAFDVMAEVKRQWHVGGHSYDTSGINISFGDYVSEVSKLMDLLENNWLTQLSCENNKKQDQKVIDDLNSISKKIRNKIERFAKDSKGSDPFYVSRVALEFAYGSPESTLFIAYDIQEKNKIWKYNYKSKSKTFTIEDYKEIEERDLSAFIKFSGGSRYFVSFDNEKNKSFLKFKAFIENKFFIKKNSHYSLTEMIDNKKMDIIQVLKSTEYEPTRTIIRKRLEEASNVL